MKNKFGLSVLAVALLAVGGFSAQEVQAQTSEPQLKIKARGELLNGVGPKIGIFVDGRLVQNSEVNHTAFREIIVNSKLFQPGAKVDVFFSNDGYEGAGKDRNLYIESMTVTGSQAAGVYKSVQIGVYDKGYNYAQATDGKDIITGKEKMGENGAMRFVLKSNGSIEPPNPTDPTPTPGEMDFIGQSRAKHLIKAWNIRPDSNTKNVGSFMLMDNIWGLAGPLPEDRPGAKPYPYQTDNWFVNVGISKKPAADGAVAAQFDWQFLSGDGRDEVKAYPAIVYGRWMGDGRKTAPHLYGKTIDQLQKAVATYKIGRSVGEGNSHLAFDIWLTNDKDCTHTKHFNLIKENKPGCRTHEILIPLKTFNHYSENRAVNQMRGGKCGTVIDGKKYTLYNAGARHWNFVIFQPCEKPDAASLNLKSFFDYLKKVNAPERIKGNEFLNSIELGVEAVTANWYKGASNNNLRSTGSIKLDYYHIDAK